MLDAIALICATLGGLALCVSLAGRSFDHLNGHSRNAKLDQTRQVHAALLPERRLFHGNLRAIRIAHLVWFRCVLGPARLVVGLSVPCDVDDGRGDSRIRPSASSRPEIGAAAGRHGVHRLHRGVYRRLLDRVAFVVDRTGPKFQPGARHRDLLGRLVDRRVFRVATSGGPGCGHFVDHARSERALPAGRGMAGSTWDVAWRVLDRTGRDQDRLLRVGGVLDLSTGRWSASCSRIHGFTGPRQVK